MLHTVLVLGVLALAGAVGAAASEQVFYGKPVRSEKTFSVEGRHVGRKRPGLQAIGEMRRSMDLAELDMQPVSPTNGKVRLPTMVRLNPLIAKPPSQYADLPLRFGRQSEPQIDRTLSIPNLPQRFGRACAECPDVDDAARPPATPHQQWLSVINWPYRSPLWSAINWYCQKGTQRFSGILELNGTTGIFTRDPEQSSGVTSDHTFVL
ncbi:unnamed protein product [Merluccius merluccius]